MKTKRILIRIICTLALVFVLTAVANSPLRGSEATSVTRDGITWTFDKPHVVGQFVTGDWWVVPAKGEDSVTVVGVDPAPAKTADDKATNGSMVNPMPGFQAFDQRAALWKGERGATYPLKLKINQSLASSFGETGGDDAGKKRLKGNYFVRYMAVLTCLGKPPSPTDFRPPYVGNDKPLYDSAKLRRDLLPDLPVPASVKEVPNLKDLANGCFSRPWVDFLAIWCGFQSRGVYETGYGREKTVEVGGAGLLLCLDKKVVGDKEPLLIDLVQTGIDLYGVVSSGGRWNSDGGWQMGRKFPILFAGLMLDNKDMLNIGKKYPPTKAETFQEDTAAFIVTKEDVGRQLNCMIHGTVKAATANTLSVTGASTGPEGLPGGVRLMGNRIKIVDGPGKGQVRLITKDDTQWPTTTKPIVTCEVEPPWDTVPEAGKSVYQVLGYQEEDIGHAKYGGVHYRLPAGAKGDNPSFYQPYSQMNKSCWTGEVLAARILGLKAAWNQDAVFQLVDEYAADTAPGAPYEKKLGGCPRFYGAMSNENPWTKFSVSGDFICGMWNAYRDKYGDAPASKTSSANTSASLQKENSK